MKVALQHPLERVRYWNSVSLRRPRVSPRRTWWYANRFLIDWNRELKAREIKSALIRATWPMSGFAERARDRWAGLIFANFALFRFLARKQCRQLMVRQLFVPSFAGRKQPPQEMSAASNVTWITQIMSSLFLETVNCGHKIKFIERNLHFVTMTPIKQVYMCSVRTCRSWMLVDKIRWWMTQDNKRSTEIRN